MTKCAELLNQTIEVDFVDINVGCPIDLVYKKVRGLMFVFALIRRYLLCSCRSDPELAARLWP